jgi:hypothetical protein
VGANNIIARTNFGLAWIYVAVSSKHPHVRQFALASLKRLSHSAPNLTHSMILGAILHHIHYHSAQIAPTSEEASDAESSRRRFSPVILSLSAFADDFDKASQQRIMSQWLVAAHHPDVGKQPGMSLNKLAQWHLYPAPGSRQLWIEASQAAGLDPREIFLNNTSDMLKAIYSGAIVSGARHQPRMYINLPHTGSPFVPSFSISSPNLSIH